MDAGKSGADAELLGHFEREIWDKTPHLGPSGEVLGATPLADLTEDLLECAKSVYKLDLSGTDLRVFGKFDSGLLTGSIKVRAAAHIMHEAIKDGRLRGGQTIIEATSGNFGIALGHVTRLGLQVISLVSRRLQEGVFEELRNEGVRIMDLDMDICPAPGMKENPNVLAAKAAAANIRTQLSELGFDTLIFDNSISKIESLLAAQDIINLAKFLAKIYGLFCPEQYDNELNIEIHRTVTAAEIDQQLHGCGEALGDYQVVCAFGTGGTSGGIGRYIDEKYGKKSVHVVFPVPAQDVAGIRTKAGAVGLTYYRPETYAKEHEIDFDQAKHLLKFFVEKGHDMGESAALALYAVMQMAGSGGRFIVIVADGIEKYRKNLKAISGEQKRTKVSLQEAASSIEEYDRVIWVHTQYTPREEGIEVIAKSLGVDKSKIYVPKASTVGRLLQTQQVPEELGRELGGAKGKSLLVCMAGNTSLMAANVLASRGIRTESLNGGITNLPGGVDKNPGEFVRVATE